MSGAYITLNQEVLLADYFVPEEEFEAKHNVGRREDEEELYMQIEDVRIALNGHTAYHMYKLFEELKEEYFRTKKKMEDILGVAGMSRHGDKYLLMTIEARQWEEILFFARNHDYYQEEGEIEWNIFNNINLSNRLLLSPNVNGTVRGDILAELSVSEDKFEKNKWNLYWEPGYKANANCMDGFDNIVKWRADYTAEWIENKLLEKAHIYYEEYLNKRSRGEEDLELAEKVA